jgi:perosamine synthetase
MNDYAACIGRVQLRKLDGFSARKRKILQRYLMALDEVDGVQPLLPYVLEESAYWLFGVRTPERDRLIRHLKSQRIATGVHYMPVALHPLFAQFNRDLPVSNRLWEELLTLPFHNELADEEVDRVSSAISDALAYV